MKVQEEMLATESGVEEADGTVVIIIAVDLTHMAAVPHLHSGVAFEVAEAKEEGAFIAVAEAMAEAATKPFTKLRSRINKSQKNKAIQHFLSINS